MEMFENPNDPDGTYVRALRNIYFVLSVCGLIFTSTLLLILSRKIKKRRNTDTILTIIAVFVDAVASGGLLFRAIFTQYPYNMLQAHYNWCAYDSLFNSITLPYSGYTLSILSLQRMLIIVFNFKVNLWVWLITAIILYLILWSQSIYQILSNNITISITEVFCVVKSSPTGKPFYLTILTLTFTTYILTIISYLAIIIFYCKQCLKQLALNLDKSVVYKECRVIIFKSLFFLIPYIFIYSGRMYCWLYEFSTGNPRTWMMDYISIAILSTSVVVNCLTILYMNKEVNDDFINFLLKLKLFYHK